MKAVVLTAGEGRRLRPLTERRPKPMLPVANRPVLEHVVEALADADVTDLVFVVGYRRDRIQSYFGDGDDWDVDIEYVVQERRLGTGHALLQAEDAVDDDYLVVNGDGFLDSDVLRRLAESAGASIAVTSADHPGDYGVVDVEDGLVKSIKEKPGPAAVAESGVVNAGAYRLDSRVFDELRDVERTPEGELSLVDVLAARARGGSVEAVWTDSWADVSHPWDLVDLNSRRADGRRVDATVHPTAYVADDVVLGRDARVGPNASVLPGTALGDNAVVGAGAVVAGSVVFGDARVGENAVLRDAVVGEGADVGPGVVVEGGPADVVSGDEVHRGVSLGGVVGDGTYVGGGARLEPGVVLGVDVRVSPGARVGGRVNSGTEVR